LIISIGKVKVETLAKIKNHLIVGAQKKTIYKLSLNNSFFKKKKTKIYWIKDQQEHKESFSKWLLYFLN